MHAPIPILAVLILSSLASSESVTRQAAVDGCWSAYETCQFDFLDTEPGLKRFTLETADVPFTPQIISKNGSETIGILNANNVVQEIILQNGEGRAINRFGNPRFAPDAFKPATVPMVMGSGVSFQTLQGTQSRVLTRRCVRVHFTEFQLLMDDDPPVVTNVMAEPGDGRCVVFITRLPDPNPPRVKP